MIKNNNFKFMILQSMYLNAFIYNCNYYKSYTLNYNLAVEYTCMYLISVDTHILISLLKGAVYSI